MFRLFPQYGYLAADLAVLWMALLFYRTNRFYLGFLSDRTQVIILGSAVAYTAWSLLWCTIGRRSQPSHAYIALHALGKWLRQGWSYVTRFPESARLPLPKFSKDEKNSILFLLLKFLYLPMMLEFLLGNWNALRNRWWSYGGTIPHLPWLQNFNEFIFPSLIDLFFISECALYGFGYAVESPRLKNVIRSVEPTFFGWAVTLACYPPFNGFINNYVSWYTSEDPVFPNAWLTFAAKSAVLVCFALYLWAAVSLGTKCSNLTNRGIVRTGAFAWVRHPAYLAKNVAWWIAMLPVFSLPAVLSMTFWTGIYFLRAITEERHLCTDPDYVAYCKEVPYRFIPRVF